MDIFLFIDHRVSMIYLLAFLLAFLPLRFSWKKSFLLAAAAFALTGILDYIQCTPISDWGNVSITLVQSVIVQGVALLLSKFRDFRALFIGISSATYVMVGNLISMLVYMRTDKILTALLVQIFIHSITLGVLIYTCRRDLLHEANSQKSYWGRLCLIPVLFYAITYSMAVWPQNIFTTPENTLSILLLLVLMVVSYTMIIQMFSQNRREQELQWSNEYLKSSAENLKREIEQTQKNRMEISFFKHDQHHANQLLLSYLNDGKIHQVREMLEAYENTLDQVITDQFCANAAVNSVLRQCAAKASQQNIDFRCETEVHTELAISEFELAIVVSNLLDNAIRAASEINDSARRYVQIRMHHVKEQLILAVSNPYTDDIQISAATGLPISTQKNGENHGFGLRSVRYFAKRTNSVFDYEITNKIFNVWLLIPLPSAAQDE